VTEPQYQLVEWRQTNLKEYFEIHVDTMENAIIIGLQIKGIGERCEIAIGVLANYIEKHKGGRGWKGGVSELSRGIEIHHSIVFGWMRATKTDKLVERSTSLGTSKVAMIERTPEPEKIWDWVDAQEQPPTFREIRDRIRQTFKPEPIDPPEGQYNVIVIDPPWPFGDVNYEYREPTSKINRAIDRPYYRMTYDEIQALDIPAADDCVMWLWVPNRNIHSALHMLEAWGFEYRGLLTWAKSNFGLGYWLRGKTEQCLLATKGSPPWTNTTETTLLVAPARADSQKPNEFYAIVDKICQGPRIDMFSREKRDGWDQWGDECDRF